MASKNLQTKLLGADVITFPKHLFPSPLSDSQKLYWNRQGEIVNVYLQDGTPSYTVLFSDGTVSEFSSLAIHFIKTA